MHLGQRKAKDLHNNGNYLLRQTENEPLITTKILFMTKNERVVE